MSKHPHNTSSLDEFSKTLTDLAARVSRLKPKLAKTGEEFLKFQYERERAKGLDAIDNWITEADLLLDNEIVRAAKAKKAK